MKWVTTSWTHSTYDSLSIEKEKNIVKKKAAFFELRFGEKKR